MVIESVIGKALPLVLDDIDTDRIIPARFLKEITFENMGQYAFIDERQDSSGKKNNHPFNKEDYNNAKILLVGKNFGCGSSREHAPQALKRYGIQAIIGESFAEIFAGNCKAIGLPVVYANKDDIKVLETHIIKHPETIVTLNLVSNRVRYFEESFLISMPTPQRESFLKGTWNVLELLKKQSVDVDNLNNSLPY
ncbi:isopropylmalate isomerase [bacterium]|nr:isopropylmalate isomerase [bacterium]|tara:strand:- start:615 stop:1199 length:585 start_codon:yes stop_codon:yes gene_type:complete